MSLPFTVVIDSREQLPYDFGPGVPTVRKALKTGDYSIEGFEDVFAVERKSLNDLLKSITWDRRRFKQEIHRGNDLGRFTVVIEADKQTILNWDYERQVHPNAVMGTIDKWETWNNVEFRWCGNRDRAKEETLKLLKDWWIDFNADELM